MPTWLTLVLITMVAALFLARFLSPRLPLSDARRTTPVSLVATGLGVVGLMLHCGAMFYGPLLAIVPGSGAYANAVNALGLASKILYLVPAVLVLVGLRDQGLAVWMVLLLTLLAVGLTMYVGAPLSLHLAAIAAAVLAIGATTALFVRPARLAA